MSKVGTNRHGSLIVRLTIGLVVVAALLAAALAPPPPGPLGELLARNESEEVQAGALFYRDLERIDEIQDNMRAMRQQAQQRAAKHD
jgi:hypothetical protein